MRNSMWAVSSVFIDNVPHTQKKEEESHWCICQTTPESVKVASVVHNEVMEKMEKWLDLWIHEIMTDRSSIIDSIDIALKANEIYPIPRVR